MPPPYSASPTLLPRWAPRHGTAPASHVNTLYVIAVITSLGCGVNVLCLRAVEPDATGQHAQTYPTPNECVAALKRLMAKAQQEATRQLDWRCVPEKSALPYLSPSIQMN
jgi:hypothetical protein